jgi:hypothetical protein
MRFLSACCILLSAGFQVHGRPQESSSDAGCTVIEMRFNSFLIKNGPFNDFKNNAF